MERSTFSSTAAALTLQGRLLSTINVDRSIHLNHNNRGVVVSGGTGSPSLAKIARTVAGECP